MLKTALWVTAVYATAAVARAASDWSCSLNGKLDATGRCQCKPAWKGTTCAQLNLVPLSRDSIAAGAYRHGTATSWGGIPIRGIQGQYHLYVSEMANNCTLETWSSASEITHAGTLESSQPIDACSQSLSVHRPPESMCYS